MRRSPALLPGPLLSCQAVVHHNRDWRVAVLTIVSVPGGVSCLLIT
ncbi:MAG: hypothetical protein VX644_09945 [Planctomycetota bacterium]|nr:hypothetical protein [Planctomycetota bacterium]